MVSRTIHNGYPLFITGYYWNQYGKVEGYLLTTSLIVEKQEPYRSKPNSSYEPRRQRPSLKIVE